MLKHSFKLIGIWLLIFLFITAIIVSSFINKSWDSTSLPAVILEIVAFLSLSMIAFSKEKKDDEYLAHLRAKSITITVLLSFIYAILDSFFFVVNHLMIMEVFQIQILAYIIVFNILKRTND